jgi:hypothetical protein
MKRLLISTISAAALLLPVTSLVFAGEEGPNPGEDNPGTTYTEIPFAFGETGDGSDDCFEEADFCADAFENPLVPSFDGLKGKQKREAAALAADYAALACAAARSSAASNYAWFFEGSGHLTLARHGNHGAMHRIAFDAALESGTMTFAAVDASANATASASAAATAEVSGMEELCAAVAADDLPPDHPAVQLCVFWEANAFASSEAVASAGAFASSSALASSESFGAVTNHTEVWAANIEKFVSVATTAAGSFSTANASAFADVFAGAYASAFAAAFIEVCAELNDGEGTIYAEICSDGWDDVDEAYANAYAEAYASAQADAWAETSVAAILPATYVNENGIYDTISFGPEADWIAGGDAQVSCEVFVNAEAEGGTGD